MIRTALVFALSIAAVDAGAAPTDAPAPPAMHVQHRDLDLTTPSGAATLERRIQRAASDVCVGESLEPGQRFRNEALFLRCRTIALARARPQMLAAIERASLLARADRPVAIASR